MLSLRPRRTAPQETAYPLPWRVDRADPAHPVLSHTGPDPADAVRVFIADDRGRARTERWGRVLPGESLELCLCDTDLGSVLTTLAWFHRDAEYLWRFAV